MIKQALIFAAGHATRMRPLTDNLPKPLLEVHGRFLLAHIVDELINVGVTKIVINGYHAVEKLYGFMDGIRNEYSDCEFILSEETELLETGGGAVQALQYIGVDQPLYMINGDAYWINGEENTLEHLSANWREEMDCLLLLQSTQSMAMTEAVGDYDIGSGGQAKRSHAKAGEYMFTGIRISHPRVFDGREVEKFSFLELMDACEEKETLYGLEHGGEWYHLSTPADLDEVNAELGARRA